MLHRFILASIGIVLGMSLPVRSVAAQEVVDEIILDDGSSLAAPLVIGEPVNVHELYQPELSIHPPQHCQHACQHISCVRTQYWVAARYLNWRLGGMDIPALITTSPEGTDRADAGVLGLSTTTVLLGQQEIADQSRSGARFEFGRWLDGHGQIGWHIAFFEIDGDDDRFHFNSTSTPILARPFFSLEPGNAGPNSDLFGQPGEVVGNASVDVTASLEGAEFMFRRLIVHDSSHRLYGLLGYQYFGLNDSVTVRDFKEIVGNGSGLAIGTTIAGYDDFQAENQFHGVSLGFRTSRSRHRWTLDMGLQMALGDNRSQVKISGQTTSTVPLPGGGTETATTPGGLLALPSNSSVFEQSDFAIVPQMDFGVSWRFNPRLIGKLGYRVLYWSKVARSGEQIDTGIDLSQLDPGQTGIAARPEFEFAFTDFVAHGLDLGLEYQF